MAVFAEQFIEIQGKEYIFRSARKEDAQMLVAYLKLTTAETPYLLREPVLPDCLTMVHIEGLYCREQGGVK